MDQSREPRRSAWPHHSPKGHETCGGREAAAPRGRDSRPRLEVVAGYRARLARCGVPPAGSAALGQPDHRGPFTPVGRPRSARSLIPRSIRWLITKATTATGSTRNGAPPLYHALGQHPLTAAQWIPILVSPWLLLLAEEARKLIIRRHASP